MSKTNPAVAALTVLGKVAHLELSGFYAIGVSDHQAASAYVCGKQVAADYVRILNAHDDLLAALVKFAAAMRDKDKPDMLMLVNALHEADKAIKLAEGQ